MIDFRKWLAALDTLEPPAPDEDAPTKQRIEGEPPRSRQREKWIVIAASFGLLAGAVSLAWGWSRQGTLSTSADGRSATALGVSCIDGELSLASTTVDAQADGVHLLVDATPGASLQLGYEGGGSSVPVSSGIEEVIISAPPGRAELSCGAEGELPGEPQSVTVRDADGHFIDPTPECAAQVAPLVSIERLPNQDAASAAQTVLKNLLQPGDAVEIAGYPESQDPAIRVVRDGKVVAALWFQRTENGLELSGRAARGCEDFANGK